MRWLKIPTGINKSIVLSFPMRILILSLLLMALGCSAPAAESATSDVSDAPSPAGWQAVVPPDSSAPVARHEAAFVRVGDKAYLLGGRGIKPVNILDLKTNTWKAGAKPPVEIHHFQPVVWEGEIWLLGAMTGGYPGETPLPNVHIYNPANDTWRTGAEIPADRRRGGAGAVVHEGKIYLVCGITDGHRGGHVAWLDAYDPESDTWEELPDAPQPRDHFQAVVHDNKLYALAGRTTIAATNPFANTIGSVDVFDLPASTCPPCRTPCPRTGPATPPSSWMMTYSSSAASPPPTK